MQKGISQAILVVLLTMIGISLASLTYIFATGNIQNIFPTEYFNTTYLRSRACLSLESVDFYNANLTLKNCGLVPLSNFRLLIDLVEVPLNLNILDPQEIDTAYYGKYLEGQHEFIVFADFAETPLIKFNATQANEELNRTFKLLISKDKNSALANNISFITVFAQFLDENNNPIPNKIIGFAKTGVGYLSKTEDTTNSTGFAATTIKSDKVGTAYVAAIYSGITNTTSMIFYILDGGGEPNPDEGRELTCSSACSPWESQGCGISPCLPTQIKYTRECSSGQCDTVWCVADPSCGGGGDGGKKNCGDSICQQNETCQYIQCDALQPQWVCCQNGICPC